MTEQNQQIGSEGNFLGFAEPPIQIDSELEPPLVVDNSDPPQISEANFPTLQTANRVRSVREVEQVRSSSADAAKTADFLANFSNVVNETIADYMASQSVSATPQLLSQPEKIISRLLPTYGYYGGGDYTSGVRGGELDLSVLAADDLDEVFKIHDAMYDIASKMIDPTERLSLMIAADLVCADRLAKVKDSPNFGLYPRMYASMAQLLFKASPIWRPIVAGASVDRQRLDTLYNKVSAFDRDVFAHVMNQELYDYASALSRFQTLTPRGPAPDLNAVPTQVKMEQVPTPLVSDNIITVEEERPRTPAGLIPRHVSPAVQNVKMFKVDTPGAPSYFVIRRYSGRRTLQSLWDSQPLSSYMRSVSFIAGGVPVNGLTFSYDEIPESLVVIPSLLGGGGNQGSAPFGTIAVPNIANMSKVPSPADSKIKVVIERFGMRYPMGDVELEHVMPIVEAIRPFLASKRGGFSVYEDAPNRFLYTREEMRERERVRDAEPIAEPDFIDVEPDQKRSRYFDNLPPLIPDKPSQTVEPERVPPAPLYGFPPVSFSSPWKRGTIPPFEGRVRTEDMMTLFCGVPREEIARCWLKAGTSTLRFGKTYAYMDLVSMGQVVEVMVRLPGGADVAPENNDPSLSGTTRSGLGHKLSGPCWTDIESVLSMTEADTPFSGPINQDFAETYVTSLLREKTSVVQTVNGSESDLGGTTLVLGNMNVANTLDAANLVYADRNIGMGWVTVHPKGDRGAQFQMNGTLSDVYATITSDNISTATSFLRSNNRIIHGQLYETMAEAVAVMSAAKQWGSMASMLLKMRLRQISLAPSTGPADTWTSGHDTYVRLDNPRVRVGGNFWPAESWQNVARPVVSCRVTKLRNFLEYVRGQLPTVAGWEPQNLQHSPFGTVVVPIRLRSGWTAAAIGAWILAHMAYPWRDETWNATIYGVGGGAISATRWKSTGISTKVAGPTDRVLLVIIDDSSDADTDPFESVNVNGAIVSLANNGLNNNQGTGNVDISLGIDTSWTDPAAWRAAIHIWIDMYGSLSDWKLAHVLLADCICRWNVPPAHIATGVVHVNNRNVAGGNVNRGAPSVEPLFVDANFASTIWAAMTTNQGVAVRTNASRHIYMPNANTIVCLAVAAKYLQNQEREKLEMFHLDLHKASSAWAIALQIGHIRVAAVDKLLQMMGVDWYSLLYPRPGSVDPDVWANGDAGQHLMRPGMFWQFIQDIMSGPFTDWSVSWNFMPTFGEAMRNGVLMGVTADYFPIQRISHFSHFKWCSNPQFEVLTSNYFTKHRELMWRRVTYGNGIYRATPDFIKSPDLSAREPLLYWSFCSDSVVEVERMTGPGILSRLVRAVSTGWMRDACVVKDALLGINASNSNYVRNAANNMVIPFGLIPQTLRSLVNPSLLRYLIADQGVRDRVPPIGTPVWVTESPTTTGVLDREESKEYADALARFRTL